MDPAVNLEKIVLLPVMGFEFVALSICFPLVSLMSENLLYILCHSSVLVN